MNPRDVEHWNGRTKTKKPNLPATSSTVTTCSRLVFYRHSNIQSFIEYTLEQETFLTTVTLEVIYVVFVLQSVEVCCLILIYNRCLD